MKHRLAPLSNSLAIFCFALAAQLTSLVFAAPARAQSPARESAVQQSEEQYQKAQQLQQELYAQPKDQRNLAEYKRAVAAYRRVYLLSSSAGAVTPALMAVGQLYREMGDEFDQAYYQSAVVTYKFLISQYPGSKFRGEALLDIGEIEARELRRPKEAKDAFEEYLKGYPHAEQAAQARNELRALASGKDLNAAPSDSERADNANRAPRASARAKQVGERQDGNNPAQQQTANASASSSASAGEQESGGSTSSNSDASSHANAEANGKPASVTAIRTWNADDYTRVVVDLNGDIQYDSARIKNPDRIYFDLYRAHLAHSLTEKELPVQNGFLKSVRVAQNKTGVVRLVLDVESVRGYSAFLLPDPYRLVIDVHGKLSDAQNSTTKSGSAAGIAPGRLAGDTVSSRAASATPPPVSQDAGVRTETPAVTPAVAEKVEVRGSKEELAGASASKSSHRDEASASSAAHSNARIPLITARAAKPTHDGERSLTRALGLKISRIVIDPGHGGHDTGTIGPDGIMEKNVCLDVALRLGKLIQKKLPGAQVIYTRKTDVFIPLEERTAIANQAKADLFISIHANSSHDEQARGIETYYLNFTTSPEALETASRENALSDASIHQLQDLIKKIARNDKVEESRELATDIQSSLSSQLRRISTAEKNRGVKKAPFVVLIGADMPSVLSEISFLSNPTDERMLEHPAQRARIAMGIFHGIESYLGSLNSLSFDKRKQTLITDRQPSSSATDRDQQ